MRWRPPPPYTHTGTSASVHRPGMLSRIVAVAVAVGVGVVVAVVIVVVAVVVVVVVDTQ